MTQYIAYFRTSADGCQCDVCRVNDLDVHYRARSLDTLCRQIERRCPTARISLNDSTAYQRFGVGTVEAPTLHAGTFYTLDVEAA